MSDKNNVTENKEINKDFETAFKLYRERKNKEAIESFKILADRGNINAMYMYGYLLLGEDDLEKEDMKIALEYYIKAIDGASKIEGEYLFKIEELKQSVINIATMNNIVLNENIDKYELENIDIEENLIFEYEDDDHIKNIKEKLKEYGYELGEKCGEGAEGIVYNAIDKNNNDIIIKILYNDKIKKYEEEILSIIDTIGGGFTKIIDKFNIKLDNNTVPYQIEIYKKREMDLRDAINGGEKSIFAHTIQIILALDKLHSKGIIHFDLKPENILINDKNVAKISDFGFSSMEKNISKNIETKGTKEYIAPEAYVLNNPNISKKNDIYSYGLILLEMFSGKKINDLLKIINNKPNIKINGANVIDLKQNLDEKLTLKINGISKFDELINSNRLELIFPNINLEQNKTIKQKIQSELLILFQGVLKDNPEDRFTSSNIIDKLKEIVNLYKEVKNNIGEKIKIDESIGRKKDFFGLGIYDENIIKYKKEKIENDLKLLLNLDEKPLNEKQKLHLKIITGNNEFSKEAKECLKSLLKYFSEEKINSQTININDFKKNLEILKNNKNKREHYLINNKIIELENLRIIDLNKKYFYNTTNLELNNKLDKLQNISLKEMNVFEKNEENKISTY